MQVPAPYRVRNALRMLSAIAAVVVLALAVSIGGLYLLLRNEALENSALNDQIATTIQKLLGESYFVDLGKTSIGFDPDGLLAVTGNDVRILRAADRQLVSRLGRVAVGVKPLSIVLGTPQIDAVIIEDSTIDLAVLPLPVSAAPVRDLNTALTAIGQRFANLSREFSSQRFRLFRFHNVRISGAQLGRREPGEIYLEDLELRTRRNSLLSLSASLSTPHSNLRVKGTFTPAQDGSSTFEIAVRGLSLREWTRDPRGADGFLASDANVAVDADIKFSATGEPIDPVIKLSANPSRLRLGFRDRTVVKAVNLELRLLTEKNQIELLPSQFAAGDMSSTILGGVRPVSAELGFAGPLQFELIASPITGAPTQEGEPAVMAGMRVLGRADRIARRIFIDKFEARTQTDLLAGTAQFGFEGETPSIRADLSSDGLDVVAIKQMWPFFIASPARQWSHANLRDGRATRVRIFADIPAGIVGRIRKGAKMAPEHFELAADFSGLQLTTFGELPPIREAAGTFAIRGMEVDMQVSGGVVATPSGDVTRVVAGSFHVDDFGVRPNPAAVSATLEGQVRGLAEISAAEPLHVPSRLSMTAEQLSGSGKVAVSANFLVKRGLAYDEVDWRAEISLKNAASSAKLYDRQIADADIEIKVDPNIATISGAAQVDGVRTTLEMREPIDGSQPLTRTFKATLDEKAQKRMGLSLDPVIAGPVKVLVEQGGGKPEVHTIDLTGARLSLPWVGWIKGRGVSATANFHMRAENGVTHLDDFYLEGDGFSAAGSLAFDKSGVVSADFADISLNAGDSIAVKVTRKGKAFIIAVDGARYDARGLINKLIHEGSFAEEQGDATVSMSARISSISGFGDESLRGVEMSYGAVDGWFDSLSLRGVTANEASVSVQAATTNGLTTFNIDSADAGASLAMVDLYRRMSGGTLQARLGRTRNGPFTGPVYAANFTVVDEPKLDRLVGGSGARPIERDRSSAEIRRKLGAQLNTKRVRFVELRAVIDKGEGYLRVADGILRSPDFGFTFDGLLFDANSNMELTGTFLPAVGLSRAIGFIPLVGNILGNGRDSGLIGITFRLRGPSRQPDIEVNPISAIAPGIFRKVFEFKN